MGDDHTHEHYSGRYSPLFPDTGKGLNETFIGGLLPTSKIGASTSTQTANQLSEVEARLREGMRVVEMGTISPTTFETIPLEHFKEMHRLAKLANAEVTVHAPLIDPSGFAGEGRGWGGEEERQNAERQLKAVVERSHDISPKGVIPITIHAAGMNVPANEWTKDEKGKITLGTMYVINQKSGEVAPLKREKTYYPGEGEKIETPQEQLEKINDTDWKNNKLQVVERLRDAEEIMRTIEETRGAEIEKALNKGEISLAQIQSDPHLSQAFNTYQIESNKLKSFLSDVGSKINGMYDKAQEFLPDDKKEREKNKKILESVNDDWKNFDKTMKKKEVESIGEAERLRLQLFGKTFHKLAGMEAPEVFKPIEKFAMEKASETLSNIAVDSYSKYKDNAPYVSIENVHPHVAMSTGEELRKLIEVTRQKFVKKMEAQGMDTERAKTKAEEMIGATWDVGHINMIRKYGYGEEKIMEETGKISKFVKHTHLHDNFGYHDSHLPPGMGNVPFKKIMESLKSKGYDGRAIIEAGAFVAEFKASPHLYSLQKLGSPIYYSAGPGWHQTPQYSSYFSSYGAVFPEQHFSMYGGGFSQLPVELGGRAGGKGGRFSGTPME